MGREGEDVMSSLASLRLDPKEFLASREFTVLWSGGKDSTAALLWVLNNVKHDNWDILYIEVTGNTHPLCTQYVVDTAKQLGVYNKLKIARREDLDFYEALKRWGVPIIGKMRYCMYQFKLRVMERHSRYIQVLGIRRSDSNRRRNMGLIDFMRATNNIIVNPILDWDKTETINYIKSHGVKLNPCYKLYGHSGNCMMCPYLRKDQVVRTLQDPEWREKILDALSYVGRGKISAKVRDKWLRLSKNIALTSFLGVRM